MLNKPNSPRSRKRNERGFTLVELIVVMGILALLAGIAVPRFGASFDKAKKQAHNTNVMMIEKAVELAIINGDINPPVSSNKVITTGDVLIDKQYLDKEPKVPIEIKVGETTYTKNSSYKYNVTVTPGDVTDQVKIEVIPGKI